MSPEDASKVDKLFDDWARRGRGEGMERGHGQTAAPLLASLPVGIGVQFLDLGCGNGWASRFAAARGAHAVGVDLSKEMVDRAQARAGQRERYERADFADLPFADHAFDVAWSMEALYYAPDVPAVLREIRRVVRSGGALHMIIDYYGENEASHSWPEDVGVPMTLLSEAGWREALEAAGFVDVASERLRAAPGAGVEDWKVDQGSLHVWGVA